MLDRMKCPRCGRTMDRSAFYCNKCSKALRDGTSILESSRLLHWLYCCILVVIILGVLYLLYRGSYH